MTRWNQLLKLLDMTVGCPNRINSTVKKVREEYDNQRNEHVVWLEYRFRTSNDRVAPRGNLPNAAPRDMHRLKQLATALATREGR